MKKFAVQRMLALSLLLAGGILAMGCSLPWSEDESASPPRKTPVIADEGQQWMDLSGKQETVQVRDAGDYGGRFDLFGNGGLVLQKTNTDKPFCLVDNFKKQGTWTSTWIKSAGDPVASVETDYIVYGQKQDMKTGWVKFAGNPLVAPDGWKHATEKSLQLPAEISDWPQDQSLVVGTGRWEGKWLLAFNIGAWAVKGWGVAVADSLAPLKEGENPFRLASPYPIYPGTGGHNAPNDWLFAENQWWVPDETKREDSHMWSSGPEMEWWTNEGVIKGMVGHDPGICYDGERYYLFNENGHNIALCVAKKPGGKWEYEGDVLEAGGHTGDADVSFFNNRWHMFFDDDPHRHYKLGYAVAAPSGFPTDWDLTHHVYGPHTPEQNQVWDDDTEEGNQFGTGDADVAVEGTTLYLTHERPIGLAWKELELLTDDEQTVELRLEVDNDGDGDPEAASEWHAIEAGTDSWKPDMDQTLPKGARVRVTARLRTDNSEESPLLRRLELSF